MERIDARFVVPTQPILNDGIRTAISNHDRFNQVSAKNVNDIWEGKVPHMEKLTVEMDGTVISLMDDWQCAVFGRSHLSCLPALFEVHRFLNNELGLGSTIDLLVPSEELARIITRQVRRQRYVKIGWALASAVVGAIISLGVCRWILGI